MFQTFDEKSTPETGAARLALLRAEMARRKVDAFIVPRADVYQGEDVTEADARLAWLSGFTGSAGFCIVTASGAGIFVDGRYRVQVRQQSDMDQFTPVNWPEVSPTDWMLEQLPSDARIGFDPWLHTAKQLDTWAEALTPEGLTLTPLDNLVDAIWADRPAPPAAPFRLYPEELAGQSSADKRRQIAEILRGDGAAAAVLTQPDSIAWLLNIRGSDVPHNPVPHALALLMDDGAVRLFCQPGKQDGISERLGDEVSAEDMTGFEAALSALVGPVLIDAKTAPVIIRSVLRDAGTEIVEAADPCILPKARKNAAEIAGAHAAQARDGVAMVRFLAWLDEAALNGGLSEIDVVRKLEGFRRDSGQLLDISFETISGSGPNGAIVHYRVTEKTNRAIAQGELLLVDSGGQYIDGTTDITRTIAIGTPDAEMRRAYTRVLQGMVSLSRVRFPVGLTGRDLDPIARFPLWAEGRDFAHGTGHGVGSYLSVHEGPQGISRRSEVALEPGMILSNEPGYYVEGAFGIRIENLILVTEPQASVKAAGKELLGFETLTHVPFDRQLIEVDLLSGDERDWINRYHATTVARVTPALDEKAAAWLARAAAPL